MVTAIHCVVIGSLAFAYKQHSIKCKVHRWFLLLAPTGYQWSTCVLYKYVKSLGSLRFWYLIFTIHEYHCPLWGIYMVLNVVKQVEARLLSGHSTGRKLT